MQFEIPLSDTQPWRFRLSSKQVVQWIQLPLYWVVNGEWACDFRHRQEVLYCFGCEFHMQFLLKETKSILFLVLFIEDI